MRTETYLRHFCTVAIALSICPAGLAHREGDPRPNIVFILSDDHACASMGCYGGQLVPTPNLDRLAAEGMRFDGCFCTEAICRPSRTAILTGKYGHITGSTGWRMYDRKAHRSFPEYLQKAGYQTALFGKYHIGTEPVGFDAYHILPGQGRYENPELISRQGRRVHAGHVSEVITSLSLAWLEARDGDEPFLLCMQDKAAHMPWEADPRFEELLAGEQVPEPATLFFDRSHPDWTASPCHVGIDFLPHWMGTYWGEPPPGSDHAERRRWLYQTYMRHYLRTAAGIDRSVGRVLEYIDRNGLRDRTIVIYSSDQGFLLGERGLFDKRWMYEPSIRMPLLVRYPPLVEPGSVNRDLVLNIDFAPTLLALAGVDPPGDMQGHSLVPLLAGRTPEDWRRAIYYRLHVNEYNIPPHRGIRTQRHKLIHFEGSGKPLEGHEATSLRDVDRWELFDLQADPQETVNLVGRAEHRELERDLRMRLDRLRVEVGETD